MKKSLSIFLLASTILNPFSLNAEENNKVVPQSKAEVAFSFTPVVRKTHSSVVNIFSTRKEKSYLGSIFELLYNAPIERVKSSLGSGVIVSPKGLIVTNYHVVKDSDKIKVVLADKREYNASIVISDPKSDIAVLKIQGNQKSLPYLPLADSDSLEAGDLVLAIGNPFGMGLTITSGIISAKSRASLDGNDYRQFIQTDAAINPGNSGGPLINMAGEVVGINTFIISKSGGSIGLGFATPSNLVKRVIASAEAGQDKVIRPWLGMHVESITPEMAQDVGLEVPDGVVVTQVLKGSPASKAGFKEGDVITHVDDKVIEDKSAYKYKISLSDLNSHKNHTVYRDGKKISLDLEIIAPPEVPARNLTKIKGQNPFGGLTVINLSPAVIDEYNLNYDNHEGILVIEISPHTPAEYFGFKPNDVIVGFNSKKISSVEEFNKLVSGEHKSYNVQIIRNGRKINATFSF